MPLSGSYPWGRVDAPQMSGWVWKFFKTLLISFPASFVKRILLLNGFLDLFSFGSLLKSCMKTTPRLMALVLVVKVLDLVRLWIPKIEVQMNPYIPHNPL